MSSVRSAIKDQKALNIAAVKSGGEAPLSYVSGRKPDVATPDTPDTCELLGQLMQAQAVAERVDASRGRAVASDVELLPGKSRGTDLAESVSELALRVRREVQGPRSKE